MPGSGFVARIVDRLLAAIHSRGILTSIHFLDLEFFGNILMFVPLGVFAALLISKKGWWILLFLGPVFSALIEIYQANFLPDRYPELRDVLSNSLGFLSGAAIALALRLLVSYRDGLVEIDRRRAEALERR